MKYIFTEHALNVIHERNITEKYILKTIEQPDRTDPDRTDTELTHYLKVITENDDRVLRVVVNISVGPVRIITVYYDRNMRGKI